MRKTAAFLTALALFIATAAGMHTFSTAALDFKNPAFGTWVSDDKFRFAEAMADNLDENSLVAFGSSEFAHGRNTPYHPKNMFAGRDLNLMVVGAGYYQCLSHAVTLSSMASSIKEKKVVLILSPQWFRRKGVVPEAYASRFSELNYMKMLENKDLSGETKRYMIERTNKLLEADPPTLKRVKLYEKVLLGGDATDGERMEYRYYRRFLEEKSKVQLVVKAIAAGIRHGAGRPDKELEGQVAGGHGTADYSVQGLAAGRAGQSQEGLSQEGQSQKAQASIDWEAYRRKALIDGEKATTSNPYGIKNSVFNLRFKPILKEKRDSALKGSYAKSLEYDDLKCFLQVCREEGIKPLLVIVPVNGPWYDYTGFPKEGREKYYENIRRIAAEYGAQTADFSGDEYAKSFFEDNVHFGYIGWVDINESIYKFAKEDTGIS